MALPFINGAAKKRTQLLSIDLGGRTTKAVHIQRRANGFALMGFALLDAPIFEKNLTAELLSEHLKNVVQAFESKPRLVSLAIGVSDSMVRHADLPQMPVSDMRQVLKANSRNYLQQDLQNHIFDCFIIPPRADKAGDQVKKIQNQGLAKFRVLVAGARSQLIDDMQTAVRSTGLVPDHILPGIVGPVNAFELAKPDVFAKEVVALVDIGFKNTTICIVQEGELMLSRVVAVGGDKITSGLAESLGISYAEAEGIKVGMPTEVHQQLESLVLPLGRELRASIDFFEHQYDRGVNQVFVTGGSSRSELILQMLQSELSAECKTWDPLSFLELALPPQQAAEIENVGPQLAVAIGAAAAAF